MGVQQLDDELIKASGRKQKAEQVLHTIDWCQQLNLPLSVDLIFGCGTNPSVCCGFTPPLTLLRALAQIRGETGSLAPAPTATQSCRCSHSGIALGRPQVFPWISGDFSGLGRRSGAAGRVRGGVASGVWAIVSRARFRGPGVGRVGWGGRPDRVLSTYIVCSNGSS